VESGEKGSKGEQQRPQVESGGELKQGTPRAMERR
jgi:hypothetical protein